MDNFNDTLLECCKNLSLGFNQCFHSELILNNMYRDSSSCEYLVNFYICMLCAGADEDIYLPSEKSRKFIYNYIKKMFLKSYELWLDPCIAVYCGEYDLADHLINIADDDDIFIRLIKAECWDYIDRITDCGKNEMHDKIIIALLTKDYLKGGDGIFKYIARYNKNAPMTNDMALNAALLEINSADKIFNSISNEAHKTEPDKWNKKTFNKRSIDLMERCAKLGMTLKTFISFKEILIPIYLKKNIKNIFCFDNIHRIHRICNEYIKLPPILAKLIDENTVVSCRNKELPDSTSDDVFNGIETSFFRTVEFKNHNHNFPAYVDELEYICIDFKKRYGKKLVINTRFIDDFCGIKHMPKELFEINLSGGVLYHFYDKINDLKRVLNYGILSQKNIDEITAYFVSEINGSSGSDYAFAIKRLRQLNDKLAKMRGN